MGYKFYNNGKKIICVSHYAGKCVRGVAKCSDEDAFDEHYGETLARARCDINVAKKRMRRAHSKFVEAANALASAKKQYEKMTEYYYNSCDALEASEDFLNDLIYSREELISMGHSHD